MEAEELPRVFIDAFKLKADATLIAPALNSQYSNTLFKTV